MNPTLSADQNSSDLPVVDFVRGQRQTTAYFFLGLSVLFLVATVLLAVRAFRVPKADTEPASATKSLDPEAPPEPPKPEVSDPKRSSYMVGGVGTLAGFMVTVTGGVVLLVGLPKPTVTQQRTEARMILLAVGGLLGFAMIVCGLFYFYLWGESLTKLLDRGERKELLFVAVPFLMIIVGAGLTFLAVQPARTEERNNSTLRKLVYGTNFGLGTMMLLVVLMVANVVVALKVPNKLDTTETGFYSLSESSKKFLEKLTETVNLYVILPNSEEREVNDIRQFAMNAQDVSDGKVTTRFISPVSNKTELARLQDKYPRVSRDGYGILLTVGADEKRHAFVGLSDLFEIDPRTQRFSAFTGEGKVMKELRFLADNEQRPVIYFTQGNGELNLTGGADAAPGPSATRLKGFLEKAYLDVKPLVFPVKDPAVPDDAAVVVVAEPQTPLGDGAVAALRRYLTIPRGDRKGKLIVLAGVTPGPEGRGVARTGLEGLLAELNVRLGDKYLYSIPTQDSPNFKAPAAIINPKVDNPIVQALPEGTGLRLSLPREVSATTTNPTYQATAFLFTVPGRYTWLEDNPITDLEQTLRDFESNETLVARKGLTRNPRPVGVLVSEGGSGKAVVIGNAFPVSDRVAERAQSSTPPAFDLISVAIDWLRDRPPVPTGIESKKYKEYTFPEASTVDFTRLVWFPLGLGLLGVTGVGAGVWVIRRK